MRCVSAFLALAVCGALAACWVRPACCPVEASAPAAVRSASAGLVAAGCAPALVDGFERDRLWTTDAAGDHAELDYEAPERSEGEVGLGVRIVATGRDKAMLRKEVDWDLSRAEELRLDVHASASGASVALALVAGKDRFYEFRPQPLQPGWNRDLRFPLAAAQLKGGAKEGEGRADASAKGDAAWEADRARVTRVVWLLQPGGLKEVRLVLDRLRMVGEQVLRRPPLRLADSSVPVGGVRGETMEFGLVLLAPAAALVAEPRGLVALTPIEGRFLSPAGEELVLPGYLAASASAAEGMRRLEGRLRLRPDRSGTWTGRIGTVAAPASVWSQPIVFQVDEPPRPPFGGWRVDPGDPRYLREAGGEVFIPIGQNLAWAADYGPWFARLAQQGGNWSRVWICPWNNPIEAGGRFDSVDERSALAIEALLAQAAERRIAVQLVLAYHGWFGSDWGRNPFNKANGGPLADPREFWTDGRAKALFRAYLDYCVARFSASPALFAWELVNECDLCPRYQVEDLVAWHREMAAHLRKRDPHRRLVTTSSAGLGWKALWSLPELDFAQPHAYTPRAEAFLDRMRSELGGLGKPVFLGELGRGWRPETDQADPGGLHLATGLWLAAVRGEAGLPAPWWWDTQIAPNRLEERFAGPAAFLQGEDPRGWHPALLAQGGEDGPRLVASVSADRVRGLLYDPRRLAEPGRPALAPAVAAGQPVEIAGCAPGLWRVEWWELSQTRAMAGATAAVVADGRLRLTAPQAGEGVAFKARREPLLAPGVTVP